jgi:phosphoenolpyruvate carboxykinase (ATP)
MINSKKQKEDTMSTKTPNGLDKLGLKDIGNVYYNISYEELQ